MLIRDALPPSYALIERDEIDSTMEDARRWLSEGKLPQALFIAARQTAGRGRRGREWNSPSGNLYATLLVPHPGDWRAAGRRGFVISLAIAQVIGLQAQVKWPNDVLVDGAKVAGILLEAVGDGLLIGFGVNLQTAPDDTPYPATALTAHGLIFTPQEFAAQAIQAFLQIQILPWAELRLAWLARARGVGNPIVVNLPNGKLDGVFQGMDDDGALQLETKTGLQLIHAGDIFFGA